MHTRVCSNHFKKEDLDRTSPFRVQLRDGAVPCIFEAVPEHPKKKVQQRKSSMKRGLKKGRSEGSETSLPAINNSAEPESTEAENKTLKRKAEDQLGARKKARHQSNRRLTKRK